MTPISPLAEFIQKHNRRGWAVGQSDIRNDAIDFTFRDEKFTFSTMRVYSHCKPDGSFYLAKVKTLRKLAKQNGAAHG